MSFNTTPSLVGDDWKPADHLGDLILCEYYEYAPEVTTRFGTMPAVRVLVTVVEGKREEIGKTFDTMFFNASLVRTGKRCLDRGQYLGRLGEQPFKNGTGVVINPPTAEDIQTANRFEKWLASGESASAAADVPAQSSAPAAPPRPETKAPAGSGTYTDDDSPPF